VTVAEPEPRGGEPVESRSSVKLVRNAKGDTQVEVKVYVGDSQEQVDQARDLAVRAYQELVRNFAPREA